MFGTPQVCFQESGDVDPEASCLSFSNTFVDQASSGQYTYVGVKLQEWSYIFEH